MPAEDRFAAQGGAVVDGAGETWGPASATSAPVARSPDSSRAAIGSVVDVWLALPDAMDAGAVSEFGALLSADEWARVRRLPTDEDQRRMLVTRGLVRRVLSRYAPVPPRALTFAVGEHGRPRVDARHVDAAGLSFNLSHTRGLIALAVCRGREVGVDAECVPDRAIAPGFEQRYFRADEAAALAWCPPLHRQARMLEYWTLKEAYLKARGLGLSTPLEAFGFRLQRGGNIRFEAEPRLEQDPGRWQFWQYRPSERHVLALCVESPAAPVRRVVFRAVTSIEQFSALAITAQRRSIPGNGVPP